MSAATSETVHSDEQRLANIRQTAEDMRPVDGLDIGSTVLPAIKTWWVTYGPFIQALAGIVAVSHDGDGWRKKRAINKVIKGAETLGRGYHGHFQDCPDCRSNLAELARKMTSFSNEFPQTSGEE